MKHILIIALFMLAGCSAQDTESSIKSLPYVNWQPMGEENMTGVTIYEKTSSFKGLNLYHSEASEKAFIMDMDGKILHDWAGSRVYTCEEFCEWHQAELDEDGDLFVIWKQMALIKLDWDNQLAWLEVPDLRFHHDIALDEYIYSIFEDTLIVPCNNELCKNIPIRNDLIGIMDENGDMVKVISLYDLFGDRIEITLEDVEAAEDALEKDAAEYLDAFHTNNVEVIGRDIPGFAEEGDLLISMRELDLIAVVDPQDDKVVWEWGPGIIDAQHNPTLTDEDTLLVFDNLGNGGHSRVIELDPVTKQILWQYPEQPTEEFYSNTRGANQELPNGNILITESDKGHVFEITREGETVWEYWNPNIQNSSREIIYRMTRLTPEQASKLPWDKETRQMLASEGYI